VAAKRGKIGHPLPGVSVRVVDIDTGQPVAPAVQACCWLPRIRIENKLHELAETTEQLFAVTAAPDDKKGERIVVITTLTAEKLAPVLERLAASDLPALWKPKANQFVRAEAFPLLGTGKLDLRGLKTMAMAQTVPSEA
jgi:acyl-[acyl-carrier-protein]-phospholipid O-acyltransferase/long-chain-fatty-acid--[acyl-carrier-protein] ligase